MKIAPTNRSESVRKSAWRNIKNDLRLLCLSNFQKYIETAVAIVAGYVWLSVYGRERPNWNMTLDKLWTIPVAFVAVLAFNIVLSLLKTPFRIIREQAEELSKYDSLKNCPLNAEFHTEWVRGKANLLCTVDVSNLHPSQTIQNVSVKVHALEFHGRNHKTTAREAIETYRNKPLLLACCNPHQSHVDINAGEKVTFYLASMERGSNGFCLTTSSSHCHLTTNGGVNFQNAGSEKILPNGEYTLALLVSGAEIAPLTIQAAITHSKRKTRVIPSPSP